ncbi:MAG: protein-methionine-sulfoxide reductase heme-binding subunit MsrQ [Acidobacteriota bacterium]
MELCTKAEKRGIPIGKIKALVWIGCLLPLVRLIHLGLSGGLGANPIEFITLSTGTWTLVFLLACLSVTPSRRLTGRNWLIRLRRPIGLFAFFYGCLHFLTYVWLDQFFDLGAMVGDIIRRPFIAAGLTAFALLAPLAATSTTAAIRRLGGRRWQALHRLVYLSAAAAVLHFWWKVKADVREPAIYGAVLAVLLSFRLIVRLRGN